MKKFSKLAAIALACVMVLVLLTACDGGAASSSPAASPSKPSSNPPASSSSEASSKPTPPPSSTPDSNASSSDEEPVVDTTQAQRTHILNLLNEARKTKGLDELEELPTLNKMAEQGVAAHAVMMDEFYKNNDDSYNKASEKQEKLQEQLRNTYYPVQDQENKTWTGTFEEQDYQYAGTSWLSKYPATANDFITQSDGYKLNATHVGIAVCTYNGKTYVELQYARKK